MTEYVDLGYWDAGYVESLGFSASLSGVGSLSATLAASTAAGADLPGSSALSALLRGGASAGAALAGSSALSGQLAGVARAGAGLAGSSALAAALSSGVSASASLPGSSGLSASLLGGASASAILSGSSALSATISYTLSEVGIRAEIQGLTPSARIELFELDTAVLGGPIYRFHAGTNALREPVTWNGEEYSPFPVQANGFDYSGQGPLPRPKLRVANVAGVMSALVTLYDDLAGCKVTRIRTLAKFLDAVNFPAGNPTADPDAEYPREVYFIDRKASEDREMVEFELASSLDMVGVMFPSRQVIQNYCPWAYRGPECGYTGTSYFDTNDQVVAVLAQDVCGKRLSSCRKRFGQYGELPYGGFPAAGLLRL